MNEQLCRELAELESENSSLEKIEERVLSLEGDERKFVEHEHELDSAIERKQVKIIIHLFLIFSGHSLTEYSVNLIDY